ncbi:fimbrial protein [Providencia sp. Je.9.19]|uniref:fimbrial protein n=1 Tax=unclassified Providencia TaxID=2633465 RepID=UPI003DA994CB
MNKLIALFWLLMMIGFSHHAPSSGHLDVEFSGVLVRGSCQLTAESINKKIRLDNLRWQFINENESSAVTPFSIGIENCSQTDLNKTIKFTWQSHQLVNINGNSYISTQGSSGVVLGLVDSEEKPIVWNTAMKIGAVSIVGSEQQIAFGVLVRKPASGEANVGDFSGRVTFAMEYE